MDDGNGKRTGTGDGTGGGTLLEKMRAIASKGGDGEDAASIRARIADIARNMGAVGVKGGAGGAGGLVGSVTLVLDASASMDMRLDGGYGNYHDPLPVRADGQNGPNGLANKARTKWEQLLEIVQVVQANTVDADLNWFNWQFYSGKDGRNGVVGGGGFSDMTINAKGMPDGPSGGTNMALAFKEMKARGKTNFVLVTDGEPDSASAALLEAQGCTISILYVGPMPRPRFLDDLAKMCGGYIESDDMLSIEGSADIIMSLCERNV